MFGNWKNLRLSLFNCYWCLSDIELGFLAFSLPGICRLLVWNTASNSKVLIILKINGSAMDNHPYPPFLCSVDTDRLLTLVLWRQMTQKGLVTLKVFHTHLNASSTAPSSLCNLAHIWKHKSGEQDSTCCQCGNHGSQMFTIRQAYRLWKQPSLYFILLFSCQAHYPSVCRTSFGLSPCWDHSSL